MMEKKTTFAPLGVVIYRDSSVGDELLCGCAEYLQLLGHRLGGVVQSNVYRSGRLKCDMYLRDLLTCERIEISNNRGNGANGCRLDGSALARACVLGSEALRANIDLFVLNKFGKEESEGRGFRSVIAEALIAGIPVVVGVSERNIASLTDFAGDAMKLIPAEHRAIANWGREAIGRRRVLFATVLGAES